MSDKIPGVPEGWELVHAFRRATQGEYYIDCDGEVRVLEKGKSSLAYPIIRLSHPLRTPISLRPRKIEKPAAYRPFKDAEEFKPHRERWWYRDDKDGRQHFPPAGYSDRAHLGASWQHRFETSFFDDGTPFGVKIDE